MVEVCDIGETTWTVPSLVATTASANYRQQMVRTVTRRRKASNASAVPGGAAAKVCEGRNDEFTRNIVRTCDGVNLDMDSISLCVRIALFSRSR
jgi:hypothetical protein